MISPFELSTPQGTILFPYDFTFLEGRYNPVLPPLLTMLNDSQGREVQKRNFRNVQVDAVGVSISNVASPFLPVFLTRLGATNFQVGLLTSMPGITGLFLAIIVGRFLETRRNVVPWYSLSRLLVISCFAFTGLITIVLSNEHAVI